MSKEATNEAPKDDALGSTSKESTSGIGITSALESTNEPSDVKTDPTYVKKLEKSLDDLKSTLGRNSKELGELRKLQEQSKKPEEKKKVSNLMYTDPDEYERLQEERLKSLREEVKAEVLSTLEPELNPVRHATALSAVKTGNPLADKLLNDQDTIAYLNEQANSEEALESYADPRRTATEAALFRRVSQVWASEQEKLKSAPPPARPEEAGIAAPTSSDNATPDVKSEAEKAKGMSIDEANKAFVGALKGRGLL